LKNNHQHQYGYYNNHQYRYHNNHHHNNSFHNNKSFQKWKILFLFLCNSLMEKYFPFKFLLQDFKKWRFYHFSLFFSYSNIIRSYKENYLLPSQKYLKKDSRIEKIQINSKIYSLKSNIAFFGFFKMILF
jgi:hypothetical protein